MAASKEEPRLIIDFEIDVELVFLSIKNSSNFPALNVSIKPSQSILGLGGTKNIAKLSVFNEIKYLAPNKEIRIFIDSYDSFFQNLKRDDISFDISYRDENKYDYKKKIQHDLSIYRDMIFFIKKY